ncbi:hypothetical protein [Streptomyces sp. NPDC048560]|uniref:hypothetical protein n=1 Tax=Streptomyces sp. NPDC048560 TaxID=3155488 RepID=UPI003416D6B7
MTTDTTPGPGPAAVRRDLLALTPETLAALTNRGLVKRAAKELAAGTAPTVTTRPDGTVHAHHPDGSVTALPPGVGLDNGRCSCAAPGVCRHLIALVLAFRSAAPADGPEGTVSTPEADAAEPVSPDDTAPPAPSPPASPAWSPGSVGDEELGAALGAPALAAARRVLDGGYGARVHRPAARAEPWVELPTCTVRFPVPGEIGYALTDASADRRGEVVALAVWAFRAADEAGVHEGPVQAGGRSAPKATIGHRLDAAAGLADELLLSGVAHAGPVLAGALARAGESLSAESLHWPAGAVGELAGQLSAYATRSAHHRPELVAALLTEIHARRRAAALPGALGTREAGTTPLRRVRLTSLGCRVRTTATGSAAEVYVAHPGAATVLVLRKEWATADSSGRTTRTTGHLLAGRRLLGTTLGKLATGNLVSESAHRTAGRVLTIAGNKLGATSITPVGAAWTYLPEPVLVRDLAALTAGWEGRPPRMIRPRVEAESVHVVALSEVAHVGYDPAEQRLEAVVRDEAGNHAYVRSGYRPECPGALDALAAALESGATHISGSVHRSGGAVRIAPIAVLTPTGVTVPDLAPGDGSAALRAVVRQASDPLTAALEEAAAALASVAHSGLRNLTDPARARLDEAAASLSRTGLTRAAALLRALPRAVDGHAEDGRTCADAWLEAQLHVLVSGELRALQTP